MESPEEFRSRLDAISRAQVGDISAAVGALRDELKKAGAAAEAIARLDRFGASLLKSPAHAELRRLADAYEASVRRLAEIQEEKRRLESLYSSGILFSSETESRKLLAKAIDVVVREIGADSGFIVIVDRNGEVEATYSRNIDPNADAGAKDLSTGVIASTLRQSKPTQAERGGGDDEFSRRNSVVRLGISAVLCVPLVHESRVLGAVYLDRRNREKPFDENDLSFLLSFARQIVRGILTSGEFSSLREMLVSDASMQFGDLRAQFSCPGIVGSSRRLFEVLKVAHKIAPTDAPVILLGENGTGKDLLAHAIHANSRRSSGPFVTINCGAIPADLLESELFGYEPGAFTGAVKAKPGKLELADGGTIFFDEIAELSLNLQAKLLRVLQKRDVERLGSVETKTIDVRFIAATNRAIAGMVEEGAFREDLYYRLKVIELTMPPLRERREDIRDLAAFFSAKYSPPGAPLPVSPEALDVLERYHWPGNIRELENVVHRSIVLAKDPAIGKGDLPPEIVEGTDNLPAVAPGLKLAAAEEEFRRLYIIKTLRDAGSVAEAAKALGINRTHFYRLLSQLGIEY